MIKRQLLAFFGIWFLVMGAGILAEYVHSQARGFGHNSELMDYEIHRLQGDIEGLKGEMKTIGDKDSHQSTDITLILHDLGLGKWFLGVILAAVLTQMAERFHFLYTRGK